MAGVARALTAWVDLMTRRALVVVLLGVVLTGLCAAYAATHLSMDTDNADLISAEVGWRQTYLAYEHAFPAYTDNLVVVVDGQTPGDASTAVDTLAGAMRQRRDLFSSVYVPGGGDFFARNGLLYLAPAKLDALADRLTRLQPFLGRLSAEPTVPTFFDLLDQAMAADAPVDLDLAPVFGELADVFSQSRAGRYHNLAWQQLIGGDQPGVSRQRFIIAQPKLDYGRLLPGAPAMQAIRQIAEQRGLDADHGIRVRQTGEVALSDEELASVMQGVAWGAALTMLVVAALLYIGLRSWALMGISLASLVAGLVGTAAFAALAVGRINLISVAFAVLYIGLGIDYAIHVCLRYREALAELGGKAVDRAAGVRRALATAIGDVGVSLGLCAVTTAAGFFAFMPTSYSGVAELGLISGVGMFISFVVSLTFLPAAVALAAPWVPSRVPSPNSGRALSMGAGTRRVILGAAIVLAGLSLWALPGLHFDASTLDLKNPHSESVETYRDLLAHSERSPLTLAAMRNTLPAAKKLADRLARQPGVASAMTIADYVPADQDDKLATIGDLALTMAVMVPDTSQTAGFAARRQAMATFAGTLADYRRRTPDAAPAVARLSRALSSWQAWFSALDAKRQRAALADLHDRLFHGLKLQIQALSDSLSARRITLDNLPPGLRERWIGQGGQYRVEATPSADLSRTPAMRAFVASVQAVAPAATGAPAVELAAGQTVSHAFVMAFIYAGVFVTLFLLVLLRSLVDTLRVLAPLVLSGLVLCASTVWLDVPFNFANVIALPLLLGVGVDSGIHVVHRLRSGERGAFFATSTARAVVLSSLTTMAGFGSLALSHHAGTASMGLLLAIGMLAILVITLLLVPALFSPRAAEPRKPAP